MSSSHKKALDNSRVDQAAPSANLQRCINRSHDAGTVVDVDQTASAIYNDSHSRQLPSDISVVDSTSTWRSNVHERNEHSYLSEARVLKSTPSLKTVDSLSCTGENESSKGFDPTMLRSFRTTNSREHAASKHASKSVSVAEQTSQAQGKRTEAYTGSFNDPVIDLASDTRKLPSTLLLSRNGANRSKYDINLSDLTSMHNIAHEMFLVRHSSMGEYPRAISSPVVAPPPGVAPLRRFISQTTYHFSDDSIADADSITDESLHTLMPPPAPHSGKYEVRQIQTRVWKANVVAGTAEEAKRKAWSSTRGWTSESDDVVLKATIDAANDQHLSAAAIATNRHLSDTEQGITAAFPEVTGDGAMHHVMDSRLEVDLPTLDKIGPRYSFATPAEADLIRSGAVTTEQLRMCAQEHLNRRSLAEPAPVRSEQPDHDCRTAGCRRQAPGPFPPSVCGIRELHCCVHCYDTNGARHSRECDVYTTDSTTVSSQEVAFHLWIDFLNITYVLDL